MTRLTFTPLIRFALTVLLLLAIAACNAQNDHWVVVNILNHSRTFEQVTDTAEVCNCVSPEQKTVSCSAGTRRIQFKRGCYHRLE